MKTEMFEDIRSNNAIMHKAFAHVRTVSISQQVCFIYYFSHTKTSALVVSWKVMKEFPRSSR